MEEELSCPICCELFIEKHTPKVLDCRHDVCQICLQSIIDKDRTVKCPQCRLITILGPGGIADLKPNFRVRNLAEIYSGCSGKDEPFCTIHRDQKLLFVCVACNVPTCQYCVVRNHTSGNHINKERIEVLKERKERGECLLKETDEKIKNCKIQLNSLTEFPKQISAECISDHVKQLVKHIQEKRIEIVCELQCKEQARLSNIEQRLNYCLQSSEQLQCEISNGSIADLNNDPDFFPESAGNMDWVLSNNNLFPDTSKPISVSIVELGTHPRYIDIKNLKTGKQKPSDIPGTATTLCTSVEELQCSHTSHILDGRSGLNELHCAIKSHLSDESFSKPNEHSSHDRSEELERCKRAADAWSDLHRKVSASLYEEMSRIMTHVEEVINEITQQGDDVIKKSQMKTESLLCKADECRTQIADLETARDTLSKLTDAEYVTHYENLAKSINEKISKDMQTEDVNFEAVFALDACRQQIYVGNVLHSSKCIYLRKQLIAQIDCVTTIQSIDASSNGYLVVASSDMSPGDSCITYNLPIGIWSNPSGKYQQMLSFTRTDNRNPHNPSCVAVNTGVKATNGGYHQYLVARTTELESYSALGSYEATLLADFNADDNGAIKIDSVAANGDGLIVIGDCTKRTITLLSTNDLPQVIEVPCQPYKITLCGPNVVFTDVQADRVHCINYKSYKEVFSIFVKGPTGVCFDESTDYLYICRNEDNLGCSSVALYSGTTGEIIEDHVVTGLDSPQDCCLLPGKKLVVADGSCMKIFCLD